MLLHRNPWTNLVESTIPVPRNTDLKSLFQKLERAVWEVGTAASNGRPWKAAEFTCEIGASGGKFSRWVRVEQSAGEIHGHPITEQEFLKLSKTRE
jgi:hypothetical protein